MRPKRILALPCRNGRLGAGSIGPEIGKTVPEFSRAGSDRQDSDPQIHHGTQGRPAGLLPLGGLVTLLQNPARGAGTPITAWFGNVA